MTLLSENVAMKPKAGIISANLSSGPVHSKQNARMAINKSLTTKKNNEGIVDVYTRGTVLVTNVNAPHRNQMSNVRTVASGNRNINIHSNELLRCKRKIHFISGQSYSGAQPASVARRNARERNRVKQVNNGFATLRSHIPPSVAAALTSEKSSPRNSTASKKLSKVETLKMAVEYIRSLQQMLEDHNNSLEKKSVIDQNGYEKQYEMDENYYSGSPVNGNPLHLGNTNQPFPENHCKVFPKIEPIDAEYFSTHRQFLKSESDVVFVKNEIYQAKSEHFNQDLHETLTSEFYTARSPVKSYYISQEESAFKNPEPSSTGSLVSDKLAFGGQVSEVPDQSPLKIECAKRSRSPNLTVLNSVSANQVMQFSGQSFLRPQCRSSASLSPTVSDACPSPTPSYSSDQSSVHQSSIVSGSSGHLISGMTHLSTQIVSGDSFKMSSPVSRPTSPKCVTPPRTLSPLSGNSVSVVPDPSSPSNHSSYSANLEFQKGSPEGYDNYDNVSPEDEELLDVISWWQQSH